MKKRVQVRQLVYGILAWFLTLQPASATDSTFVEAEHTNVNTPLVYSSNNASNDTVVILNTNSSYYFEYTLQHDVDSLLFRINPGRTGTEFKIQVNGTDRFLLYPTGTNSQDWTSAAALDSGDVLRFLGESDYGSFDYLVFFNNANTTGSGGTSSDPVVSIGSPTSGQTYDQGDLVNFSASVTADDPVDSVVFQSTDHSFTDYSSPYSTSYTASSIGSKSLSVTAYSNGSTGSESVSYSVQDTSSTNTGSSGTDSTFVEAEHTNVNTPLVYSDKGASNDTIIILNTNSSYYFEYTLPHDVDSVAFQINPGRSSAKFEVEVNGSNGFDIDPNGQTNEFSWGQAVSLTNGDVLRFLGKKDYGSFDYLVFYNNHGSGDGSGDTSEPSEPEITITSPQANQTFLEGEQITYAVDIKYDGDIDSVIFESTDTTMVDYTSPFSQSYNAKSEGQKNLTVYAYGSFASASTSYVVEDTSSTDTSGTNTPSSTFVEAEHTDLSTGLVFSMNDASNDTVVALNTNSSYYFEYTLQHDVDSLVLRINPGDANAKFRMAVNGTDSLLIHPGAVSGFADFSKNLPLSKGDILKFSGETSYGYFDYLELFGISGGSVQQPTDDPVVSISSPSEAQVYDLGDQVNFAASVSFDGTVDSVVFQSTDTRLVDASAPYSGSYTAGSTGNKTLTVTAYGEGKTGSSSVSYTINDTTTTGCDPLEVVSLTLVHAGTQGAIKTLSNGDTINKADYNGINIRADVCSESVESVEFILNGNSYRIESVAPFALDGDGGGSYNDWNPSPGTYTLKAIPYDSDNANGNQGTSKTLSFVIVDESSQNEPGGGSADICGDYPGGRIALLFDGNQHDVDDYGALPMAMALIDAAGLNDSLVLVQYANHIGNNNSTQESEMITSAQGAASRFNFPSSILVNVQDDVSASTQALANAINNSSASSPLWIVAGGPMETAWRGMNAANQSKRQYVRLVSHSSWNETHTHGSELVHTWSDLKNDFSGDGAQFYEILDQNGSNGNLDFQGPTSYWDWLSNSGNPDWNWLRNRNSDSQTQGNQFDVSDAGMTYWLISGGPTGGCETCGPNEVENLFKNPCSSSSARVSSNMSNPESSFNKTSADSEGNAGQPETGILIQNRLSSHLDREDISIFPNPSYGRITVQLPEQAQTEVEVKLFNQTGKLVLSKSLTSEGDASFQLQTDLPPGVYIINVISSTDVYQNKLIIRQ